MKEIEANDKEIVNLFTFGTRYFIEAFKFRVASPLIIWLVSMLAAIVTGLLNIGIDIDNMSFLLILIIVEGVLGSILTMWFAFINMKKQAVYKKNMMAAKIITLCIILVLYSINIVFLIQEHNIVLMMLAIMQLIILYIANNILFHKYIEVQEEPIQ